MCENGGICIDGTCDCPDGFTGPSCSEQATPDKMRISFIEINRFPGFNHDQQWDDQDGPDIFFRLYDKDQPLAQPMLLWENANPEQDYSFFINIIDMWNVHNLHTLQLIDYDGPGFEGDLMGEIQFTPYNDTNGFPERIVLDNGGPVSFTMEVEYLYNNNND